LGLGTNLVHPIKKLLIIGRTKRKRQNKKRRKKEKERGDGARTMFFLFSPNCPTKHTAAGGERKRGKKKRGGREGKPLNTQNG